MSRINILDQSLTPLATVRGVLDAARTERINGDNTLSFGTTLLDPATRLITADAVLELDGDYFDVAYYKREQQSGGVLTINVEAEHVSYRLNNPDLDVEFFTEIGSPAYILGKILEGTGFTPGTVEFSENTTFAIQEATSRRGLLMQFIAYLGGEALFNQFAVSVIAHRGSVTPVDLVSGKNIEVLAVEVDKRSADANGNPAMSYNCGLIRPVLLALGDEVYMKNTALEIDTTLRIVSMTANPYRSWEVEIEVGNYVNSLEDDLFRIETQKVSKDALMNGIRIGPEYGFEAVRNDKKARAYFNSTNLAFQAGDGTGDNWTNKLYYDYDPDTGLATLVFDGNLSANVIDALRAEIDIVVSNITITNILAAEKGYIAELTVDRLDTSTKVQRYLAGSTAAVDYQLIEEERHELRTASTDGSGTEQVTGRNGELLYWKDDTHTEVTTDTTPYPVTVYQYAELVKWRVGFEQVGDTVIPVMRFGAGTPSDPDKDIFEIYKVEDGAYLRFITDGGDATIISLTGFVDAKMRRTKSCVINKSAGTVTITPEGMTEADVIQYAETAGGVEYTWPDGFKTTVTIG